MPPVEPLSRVPSTAPRRSAATRPAASGPMTCAATVVTPTTAAAARSGASPGAQPAASRPGLLSRARDGRQVLYRRSPLRDELSGRGRPE
ncbi:hypothetical protein ACFCYC_03785 [Streptomyces sp. NPDC056402]|uniref:hypothetical protein n=1 Tax=Streptomyces sp. NPDC056402 TaxID=3345810 RepID=UPI0035E1B9EB